MEELKDVVLNVYSLSPTDAGSEPSSSLSSSSSQPASTGRSSTFLARLLPAVGLGAYHTELVLDGHHYTFAANAGIVKTAAVRLPVASASLQESIPLGACGLPRGEINAVVKKLGELYFKPNAYHLVHRNCNHFTETLATALILYDDLIESGGGGKKNKNKPQRLTTYPDWINRLASTSSLVVSHDEDIVPCRVWEEAAQAVGAGEKVGWGLDSSSSGQQQQRSSSKTGKSFFSSSSSSKKKKELSDKQKAILAKLRKK